MRRAIFIFCAFWAGAGVAQAQYSDEQISQALMSTAWCSFTYNSGASRWRQARFQSSGILQISTRSERGSSGPNGSVYGESNGGDTYRWQIQNGQLILADDEGVQAHTLDESRTSNGTFVLLVDGQEWTPC